MEIGDRRSADGRGEVWRRWKARRKAMFEIVRPGYRLWSPHDWPTDQRGGGNIDVHVFLDGGEHYVGTVFALENVSVLLEKFTREERLPGVWSTGMVIVERVDEATTVALIDRLIEVKELASAFELVIDED